MKRATVTGFLLTLILTPALVAQTLSPPGFDDFGQWETLSRAGSRGGFSPDGRWLAYAINRTNRENELRILKLAGGDPEVIPFGTQPAYSSDSRWVAYSIGHSETDREALRRREEPIQNR